MTLSNLPIDVESGKTIKSTSIDLIYIDSFSFEAIRLIYRAITSSESLIFSLLVSSNAILHQPKWMIEKLSFTFIHK